MKFILLFIGLSIVNVIFSTIRSITTIKGGKTVASIINGGYFAFYNIVLVYTVADFPMWQKCVITFVCNVIGVYIVKLIEEKMRKDKLWRVEFVVRDNANVERYLQENELSYTRLSTSDNKNKFEVYCKTQKDSIKVKSLLSDYNIKYFVNESKVL